MDERAVFERFHEALELEPRAGAYERFRAAFVTVPAAAGPRPAIRLRFSKISLRVAAAVAVVAILIALVAGILATHHTPTAGVPAGPDKNTQAYQALMMRDYGAMNASTSNHCGSINDPGCAAAIAPVNATLQKWIDDLAAFQTPPAYASLDAMIRRHLHTVIVVQNAAIQYQKANNAAAFTFAMNAAFYERAWIDPASFTTEGRYQRLASSYKDAVQLSNQWLEGCNSQTPGPADRACSQLQYAQPCYGPQDAPTCEGYIEDTLTQLEAAVVGIVENPAPSHLATQTADFLSMLVKADDALLSLTEAMVARDATKAADAQVSFASYIEAAESAVGDLVVGQ